MVGIKLVDASDVAIKGVKSKSSSTGSSSTDSADKAGYADKDDSTKIVGDIEKVGSTEKSSTVQQSTAIHKDVKTIKLKQDIYYGPKNANKNKFVRLYKKIRLSWREGENIDGAVVDCWCNADKSQYIIKLPEEGEYKRFKFHGCDEIYNYFLSLGAVTFELSDKDNVASSSHKSDIIDNDYKFVGADLLAHRRTEQLLKNMPLNWGVKWK